MAGSRGSHVYSSLNEGRQHERRTHERRSVPKFKCPICEAFTVARVINSRMNRKRGYYWRRHLCSCGGTYTTKQVLAALDRPSESAQKPRHI